MTSVFFNKTFLCNCKRDKQNTFIPKTMIKLMNGIDFI